MSKIRVAMDATMLSSIQACPRKTYLRFERNLIPKGGKSDSLEAGSLAHIILEWFNRSLINGKSRNEAIAIGFQAGQEYIRGYSPENKYVTDESEQGIKVLQEVGDSRKIGIDTVLNTMEQYFDYYKNDHWIYLASEETKGRVIYSDDDIEVLWKAKFDTIVDTNNGIMSMDYKTMKQNRTQNDMSNQFMGQCVLLNSRNMIVGKIGFQKNLSPAEKFERVIINYSADRLAEWAFEIVPFYARMLAGYAEAGHYPPNFTQCESKYGWCEFKRVCSTDRNLREAELEANFEKGKQWDV